MANEVELVVTGDDRSRRAFQQAADNVDRYGVSIKRVREVTQGLLANDLIQQIGQRAQQFLGQATQAASGLEQAIGGTQAVFGEASAAVDHFGRTSAQSVGLSQREFREATTSIGGQLKRMTGDVELAASSSIQLVQVGADLAATYGGTTKQAVDAFSAALRGEADPAERFNLNLKISQQNAKAVELGLAATTSEVDDNARAQALLALVMEQSADAQGQFAREADSAAVAQQRANAQWEDAQAKLGQILLPMLVRASAAVTTLAEGFLTLPGPTQQAIGVIALLGAGLLILVPRLTAAKVALIEMGVAARTANVALGAVGVALAALAAVTMSASKAEREATFTADEFAGTLDQQTGAITSNTAALVRRKLEQEGVIDAAQALGIASNDLVDAVLGEEAALRRVNDALDNGKLKVANLDGQVVLSKEQLAEWIAELEQAETQTRETAAGTEAEADAHREAATAARGQVVALEELSDTLRAQADPMFAVLRSQQQLRERQQAYTEAVKEFGRESPEAREALLALTEAGLDAAGAAADAAGQFDGRLTPSMRAALRAAGLSEKQIKDLEKQLKEAGRQADRTRKDFNQLADTYNVNVVTRYTTHGSPPPRGANPDVFFREHGGISGAEPVSHAQAGGTHSGMTMVGEAGPEIVDLPFGTRVIPAGQSRAMLREAQRALEAIRSGRQFFEDFSFRGGGGEQFNDFFSDWFYGGGGRFNRGDVSRFLTQLVDELRRRRHVGGWLLTPAADEAPSGAAGAMATQHAMGTTGGRTVIVNIYMQGSIRSDREFIEMIRDEFLAGGFRGIFDDGGAP